LPDQLDAMPGCGIAKQNLARMPHTVTVGHMLVITNGVSFLHTI
jgi:hypothetical protein